MVSQVPRYTKQHPTTEIVPPNVNSAGVGKPQTGPITPNIASHREPPSCPSAVVLKDFCLLTEILDLSNYIFDILEH